MDIIAQIKPWVFLISENLQELKRGKKGVLISSDSKSFINQIQKSKMEVENFSVIDLDANEKRKYQATNSFEGSKLNKVDMLKIK